MIMCHPYSLICRLIIFMETFSNNIIFFRAFPFSYLHNVDGTPEDSVYNILGDTLLCLNLSQNIIFSYKH